VFKGLLSNGLMIRKYKLVNNVKKIRSWLNLSCSAYILMKGMRKTTKITAWIAGIRDCMDSRYPDDI
jgi:hypothetical protein